MASKDYQDRILFDRYALKDTGILPKVEDDVVVSLTRKFAKDGEENESRELGVVIGVAEADGINLYDIALKTEAPQDQWEIIRGLNRSKLEVLVEKSYEEVCDRIANGIVEGAPNAEAFRQKVYQALLSKEFIGAGRIMAGLGCKGKTLTFFNCYVFAPPKDSREDIVDRCGDLVNTFSLGGGVGLHCSSLRPRGAVVKKVIGRSSGAVSWMELYNKVTGIVEQAGSRRGASLIGLWCWHPDIIEFIEAKSKREEFRTGDVTVSRNKGLLENCNVSVLISDSFMEAVEKDEDWPLVFPDHEHPSYDQTWEGDLDKWIAEDKPVITYKVIKAKDLWNKIIEHAWASGEPGLLFMERMNKMANSYYYATISCTNPCGEIPLPPNAVCNLGHINLSKLVDPTFDLPNEEKTAEEAKQGFKTQRLKELVDMGVRFLDKVTDLNYYHDPKIEKQQKNERRIGLGILGYGELLVRLGLRYGSEEAIKFTDWLFSEIAKQSYLTSCSLAKELGPFPRFKAGKYIESGFMKVFGQRHPDVVELIKQHGIRNVTLNTIAPTGSVGTMLNTTTGIEPYFMAAWTARSRIGSAEEAAGVLTDIKKKFGDKLPIYFVTTDNITPEEHVKTQAAAQKWIDQSISKTVNMPNNATKEDVAKAYKLMYQLGCKGGTVYRDGSRDRQVLYRKEDAKGVPEHIPVEIVDEYKQNNFGILRPKIKAGISVTFSKETPVGSLHSHIRMHPKTGAPYDMFMESGKGDISADVQALGRLISVILRWPNGEKVPQETRLEIIRDQLHRIPGRGQVGFGTDKVLSLPDGVAQVMNDYLSGNFPLSGIPMGNDQLEDFVQRVGNNKEQQKQMHDYLVSGMDQEEPEIDITEFDDTPSSIGFDFDICPKCGNAAYVHIPNKCPHCLVCMHTEC